MLYRKQWVDINSIAKLGKDLFIQFNTLICCYKRLGDSSIHMMQFVGVMYVQDCFLQTLMFLQK